MARSGEIYIDLSSWGYDDISLGSYNSQDEETEFIGEEQVSAYGTMQILNIANKKRYKLNNPYIEYADYIKIRNFIISSMGQPVEIYIDTEGGNIIGTLRITATRKLVSGSTNDSYEMSLEIKEV